MWRSRSTTMRWLRRSTSSSSAEMNSTRHAVLGEVGDELLDLGLGADVDAARRLVEDQQPRCGGQPAREQHLLLVAAGEVADERVGVGRPDVERLDVALRQLVLPRLRDRAGASRGRPAARARCCRARSGRRRCPRRGGSPRRTRCGCASACRGRAQRRRLAARSSARPLSARSTPPSRRASSVRPGAEQAGEADDLARVRSQVDRLDRALAPEARRARRYGGISTRRRRPTARALLEVVERRRAPCRSSSARARSAAARR